MAKMEGVYSDEPLDGLLRVLVELGGDRLNLQTDADPVAFQGDRKLRLTLPSTSNATLQTLCGGMANAHTKTGSTQPSTFTYHCKSIGKFVVDVEGSFAPDEAARLHIRRLPNEVQAAVSTQATPSLAGAPVVGPSPTVTPSQRPAPPSVNEPLAAGAPSATVSRGTEPHSALSRGVVSPAAVSPAAVRLATHTHDWSNNPQLLTLVRQALDNDATDLHLTDGQPCRFRSAARLTSLGQEFHGVASLLDATQLETVNAGHAVDLALTFEGRARLRINAFKADSGLCAAIRFLPLEPPPLASLGLPPELLSALGDVPHGLVLVCGYTGSGKSTTMASLLHHRVSQNARHLITLESPLEYIIPQGHLSLVRQREVGAHVSSFAAGLRDALREDPDELMIGEMRDAETIGLALTAAETGHLVWSSLHSRTARSAIERIIDQVPAAAQRQVRGQLADSLRVVICQRLIAPDPEARGFASSRPVVAAEVMIINSAVAHLIREGKTEQLGVVIQSGKDAGMLPLEKDLARLVRQGRVSRAAARAQVTDQALFDRYTSA